MKLEKEIFKIPNLLSLYRLLLSLIIPILWIRDFSPKWLSLLIFSGALSDTLDGNLARLLKQKTNLGKVLDPIADKCFINMLFFLFLWEGLIKIPFFTVILLRDILILGGALYLLKRGLDLSLLSPTILGKTSTVLQLFCLLILSVDYYLKDLPTFLVNVVLNITLFLTTASGFHYFLRFRRFSLYKVPPQLG